MARSATIYSLQILNGYCERHKKLQSLPNGEDGLVYKRQYKAALGIIDALEVFRRERGTYHG